MAKKSAGSEKKGFRAKKAKTKKEIKEDLDNLTEQNKAMMTTLAQMVVKNTNQLNNLKKELSTLVDLLRYTDESKSAAEGDKIMIDYYGRLLNDDGDLEDVSFQGGKGLGYTFELGKGLLVEGFEEQLVDSNSGDIKKIEVQFPEDYGREELANKKAVFDVEVIKVFKKKFEDHVLTLDTALAKVVSEAKAASEENENAASAE